jgi:hypothetical protein
MQVCTAISCLTVNFHPSESCFRHAVTKISTPASLSSNFYLTFFIGNLGLIAPKLPIKKNFDSFFQNSGKIICNCDKESYKTRGHAPQSKLSFEPGLRRFINQWADDVESFETKPTTNLLSDENIEEVRPNEETDAAVKQRAEDAVEVNERRRVNELPLETNN